MSVDFKPLKKMTTGVADAGALLEMKATYTRNDSGNAKRFIDAHGDNLRYVLSGKIWLAWDGSRWLLDDTSGVHRLAQQHARDVLSEATEIKDDDKRKREVQAALVLGNANKLSAMLDLARHDERVVIRQSDLDANPFLLGVRNGVVDLRTGTFRPGQRGDNITKSTGTEFIADADCPLWRAFLRVVLGEDENLIGYVQKAIGYTLSGSTQEQCLFFLHGGGSNGKSTFMETVQALLGEYAQRAPQSLFTVNQNGREPTNEIARVVGTRLVIGAETEEGSRWAESRIKDLTGGDTITGRCLYKEAFDFKPTMKLWLFGNHKPEIRGVDLGIWRRVRLLPFTVQIPDAKKDRELPQKLLSELPGILNWAIEGYLRWNAEGLKTPALISEAVAEYQESEDLLGDFLDEFTIEDPNGRIGREELYALFTEWCKREGIKYQFTAKSFNKKLRERPGFADRAKKSGASRYWSGLALKYFSIAEREERSIPFAAFVATESPGRN